MRNAPKAEAPRADDVQDLEGWQGAYLRQMMPEPGSTRGGRKANPMGSAAQLSLIGAGKSHLQASYVEAVKAVGGPACFYSKGKPPVFTHGGNYSRLCMLAKEHQRMLWAPDEMSKGTRPLRGPEPKGTSATQMVNQAELFSQLLARTT